MRTQGFRLFAIMSMLALLSGSQLCMIVRCSPKQAMGPAHACCAQSGATGAPAAPAPHESAMPCGLQVTEASAPALEPPAAPESHALAVLLVAVQMAEAPAVAPRSSPLDEAASPPPSPPGSAAGSRAPPLA